MTDPVNFFGGIPFFEWALTFFAFAIGLALGLWATGATELIAQGEDHPRQHRYDDRRRL